MSAPGDEDVCRLDIAMDDALGVRRVQCIGDLDRQRSSSSIARGCPSMACFKVTPSRNSMAMKVCRPARRSRRWCRCSDGSGQTRPEPRGGNVPAPADPAQHRRAGTSGRQSGQERVLRLIDDAHAAAAEFLDDAVVGDGLIQQAVALRNTSLYGVGGDPSYVTTAAQGSLSRRDDRLFRVGNWRDEA